MSYFTVYKSSAGSGKTFTLVADYLAIALKSSHKFSRILALTFTNKAAAEMKGRILQYLKLIILFPDVDEKSKKVYHSLITKISEKTGFDEELIKGKSKDVLQLILHRYSEFSVGTIDSFFHRLVRNFANDLKIPVNFEIELNASKVYHEAVYQLIEQAVEDKFLMKALIDFAIKKLEEGKSWNIHHQLSAFSTELLKENSSKKAAELHDLTAENWSDIIKKITQETKRIETIFITAAKEACDIIKSNTLTHEHFYYKSNGPYAFFEKFDAKTREFKMPNNTVKRAFEDEKLFNTNAVDVVKNKIIQITPKLKEYFDIIVTNLWRYNKYSIIGENIYECALLNEINHKAEAYKAAENILFIKDFNEKIYNIIIQEYIPFIYERIGEKYEHLLVDEFQDTSQMQWLNILPVIEHSLTSQNYNLVVGDAKQAIYRWRNGEVEQFIKLPEIMDSEKNAILMERQQILVQNCNCITLATNNRSKKEIVAFNNDFFTFLHGKINNDYINEVYKPENLIQNCDENNTGGLVKIHFMSGNGSDELKEAYLNRLKEIIDELREKGMPLKDIAVLCRRNEEGCRVANFLTQHAIPVVSSESLLLKTSPEVQFIVALMQYYTNVQDDIAFATLIRYLTIYLNSKKNKDLSFDGLYNSFSGSKKSFIYFCNKLLEYGMVLNSAKLEQLSLSEWCEEVIRSFHFQGEYNLYINYFLDKVVEYEQKKGSSFIGFLNYWEESKDSASVVLSAQANAVQIMTIHKSKGLQFPVVIFPFAEGKMRLTNEGLWVSPEIGEIAELPVVFTRLNKDFLNSDFSDDYKEEYNKSVLDHLNVLYVLQTRPSRQLHIITRMSEDKKNEDKKDFPLDYHKWYYEYCKEKGFDIQAHDLVYTYGEDMIDKINEDEKGKRENNNKKDDNLNLQFISEDWRNKISLSFRTKYGNFNSEQLKGKAYGILIHKILAEIKSKSDVEAALQHALISGLIEDFQFDDMRQKIWALMNDSEIGSYFEHGLCVKTEAEIILPDGKQYRPDRLIFKENRVIIIDFKTGKNSDKYSEQVLSYAELLKTMGYQNIDVFLLFTDDIRLVRVL